MMRIMRRLLITLAVGYLLFGGLTPTPVRAAIASPATLSIDQVEVYRNALELLDQLYIFTYTIEYAVNPTEGNARELFIVRLMNGAVELGSVQCSDYFDDGYDKHIVSLYFDAASAPAWNGAYTIYIQGQPTLTWVAGDPPQTFTNTIQLWYDGTTILATSDRLTTRLRVIGRDLETDWGGTTDLVETISTGVVVTADGETFFAGEINRLRTICPDLFGESMVAIEYTEETYTQTYATTLQNRLLGTKFDFTDAAASFNMSRIWFSTIVWMLIVVVPILIYMKIATNSYKLTMLVASFLIPIGALAGFVPLLFAVGMAFLLSLIPAYSFFYQKTG